MVYKLYYLLSSLFLLVLLNSVGFCEDPPSAYLDPAIFSGFEGKEGVPPSSKKLTRKTYVRLVPQNWAKSFHPNEVTFLRMSGTRNRILFLSEREVGSSGQMKRTVTMANMAGETIKVWGIAPAVENVRFEGEAKGLFIAVPFFEGRRYAIATSGDQGRVYFLDDKGRELRHVVFKGGASSLSWSTVGNLLVAFGKQRAGAVYSGIQRPGKWLVKGWDGAGAEIWDIIVEGELIDFYTAWNGKNVVVLSRTAGGDLITSYDSQKTTM